LQKSNNYHITATLAIRDMTV